MLLSAKTSPYQNMFSKSALVLPSVQVKIQLKQGCLNCIQNFCLHWSLQS